MYAHSAPMLKTIRRRSNLLVTKRIVHRCHYPAKGMAVGVGLYLTLVFVLGSI